MGVGLLIDYTPGAPFIHLLRAAYPPDTPAVKQTAGSSSSQLAAADCASPVRLLSAITTRCKLPVVPFLDAWEVVVFCLNGRNGARHARPGSAPDGITALAFHLSFTFTSANLPIQPYLIPHSRFSLHHESAHCFCWPAAHLRASIFSELPLESGANQSFGAPGPGQRSSQPFDVHRPASHCLRHHTSHRALSPSRQELPCPFSAITRDTAAQRRTSSSTPRPSSQTEPLAVGARYLSTTDDIEWSRRAGRLEADGVR